MSSGRLVFFVFFRLTRDAMKLFSPAQSTKKQKRPTPLPWHCNFAHVHLCKIHPTRLGLSRTEEQCSTPAIHARLRNSYRSHQMWSLPPFSLFSFWSTIDTCIRSTNKSQSKKTKNGGGIGIVISIGVRLRKNPAAQLDSSSTLEIVFVVVLNGNRLIILQETTDQDVLDCQ